MPKRLKLPSKKTTNTPQVTIIDDMLSQDVSRVNLLTPPDDEEEVVKDSEKDVVVPEDLPEEEEEMEQGMSI